MSVDKRNAIPLMLAAFVVLSAALAGCVDEGDEDDDEAGDQGLDRIHGSLILVNDTVAHLFIYIAEVEGDGDVPGFVWADMNVTVNGSLEHQIPVPSEFQLTSPGPMTFFVYTYDQNTTGYKVFVDNVSAFP